MLREIFRLFLRFVPAMVVCTVPVLLVYLDAVVFKQECDELGIVEFSQTACLMTVVSCVLLAARRRRELRGGLALVAGFFAAMLVREQDQLIERVLPHGFWLVPALGVTFAACAYAFVRRETILSAFRQLAATRAFSYLPLGLFTVLAFARAFGGKMIWKHVALPTDYRLVKHVSEEGTELFGYAILVLWAVSYLIETRKESK